MHLAPAGIKTVIPQILSQYVALDQPNERRGATLGDFNEDRLRR